MEDAWELKSLAVDYYTKLFASESNRVVVFVSGAFPPIQNDFLEKIQQACSEEETLQALKGMSPYKVPGLDRFQAIFFKNIWRITRTDVVAFVKGIMEGGDISLEMAEAVLVLIPKVLKPAFMKEFRPVSLCNTAYKLVSKVIVNRLREA